MTKEQRVASEPEIHPQRKTTKMNGRQTAKDESKDLTSTKNGKEFKVTPTKEAVVSKKTTSRNAKVHKSEQNPKTSQRPSAPPKSKRRKVDGSDDEPVATESEPAKSVKNGRLRKSRGQTVAESSGVVSQQGEKLASKKRKRETADGKPPAKKSRISKSAQRIKEDASSNLKVRSEPEPMFPPVPPQQHQSWMEKFNYNHKHYQKELKKLIGRPKWPPSKAKHDVMDQAIFKAIGGVWRTSWTSGEQYSLAIPREMASGLKGSQVKLNAIPGKCYELILPLRLNNGNGDSVLVKVEARAPTTKEEPLEIILTLYDSEKDKRTKEHVEILTKAEQIVQRCGWWIFKDQNKEPTTSNYNFAREIIEVPKDSNTHPTVATVFYAWAIMLNLSPTKMTTEENVFDRGKQAELLERQVLNCVLAGIYDLATIEAFLIAYKYVKEPPMEQSTANHAHPIIYLEDGCVNGFVDGITPNEWKVALDQAKLLENGNAPGTGPRNSKTEPEATDEDHGPANDDHDPSENYTDTNFFDPAPDLAVAISFRRRRRTKIRVAEPEQLRRNEWQEIYQSWRNKNAVSLSAWASRSSRSFLPQQEQLYEEHVFGGIGALWAGLWLRGQIYGFGRSDTFQLLRAQQPPNELSRLTSGATMGIPEGSITLILPLVGYGKEFSVIGLEEVPSPVRKTRSEKYQQRADGHWVLAVAERPYRDVNVVVLRIYDSLAGEPSEAVWEAAETMIKGSGLFGIDILGHPVEVHGHIQFDRQLMACPQQPSGVACGVSTIVNAWCYMLGIVIPTERKCYDDDNDQFLKEVEVVIAQAMDGVMDAFGIRAFLYSWGYTTRERLSDYEDEPDIQCRAVGKDCQSLNSFITGVLKAENRVKLAGT